MKSNSKKAVIDAIAETQDGHLKSLGDMDDFSQFILNRIDFNCDNSGLPFVDVESLATDFKYMINQLKSALKPLEQFINDHPPVEIPTDTKYFPMSDEMMNDLLG